QRPLTLGADVVLHSTTKFIEGHNATLGGALITDDAELDARFDLLRKSTGTIQAPFDAWLTLQGVKTLPLRVRQHSENAFAFAELLASHPLIETVHYPWLENFPQFELAKRQQNAGGGLIAFEVRGGFDAAKEVMNSVRLCSLAENLGSAETLITHPASMTHGDVPKDQRADAGITDGLVRLPAGLEGPRDTIAGLEPALTNKRSEAAAK